MISFGGQSESEIFDKIKLAHLVWVMRIWYYYFFLDDFMSKLHCWHLWPAPSYNDGKCKHICKFILDIIKYKYMRILSIHGVYKHSTCIKTSKAYINVYFWCFLHSQIMQLASKELMKCFLSNFVFFFVGSFKSFRRPSQSF